MSQWPNWLRRQYGELEICGSSPGYDTNFSLKSYHLCGKIENEGIEKRSHNTQNKFSDNSEVVYVNVLTITVMPVTEKVETIS